MLIVCQASPNLNKWANKSANLGAEKAFSSNNKK